MCNLVLQKRKTCLLSSPKDTSGTNETLSAIFKRFLFNLKEGLISYKFSPRFGMMNAIWLNILKSLSNPGNIYLSSASKTLNKYNSFFVHAFIKKVGKVLLKE